MKHIVPYAASTASKRDQISRMFDSISSRYDLLNRLLSMGIDKIWRARVINILISEKPSHVLDVATGTADIAIAAINRGVPKVTGVDISEGMLRQGKEKINRLGMSDKVTLEIGDSENLSFPDNSFDAVTVAFGVRNFENISKGLKEIYRVLTPGSLCIILEFSKPHGFPFRYLYQFYSNYVLPVIGRIISKDSGAYTYLPESVSEFPFGSDFTRILEEAGFKHTTCRQVTFGIASIYTGRK